jgi:hypothetical protein
MCDGRVYLVLAANGCSGSGGGSGTSRGQLHPKDGREIVWSCSTQDGKSGKVIIDGQEFDLNQGLSFSSRRRFPELAKADPRIATFLQSCKDSE